jgi:putative DNA primase/helicase
MEDQNNCYLQDTEILKKLTKDEEINGLLIWALEGLDRLTQTNKFSNETSSNKIKKYWLRKSNSVSAFIEDNIEIDYDVHMTKQNFRKYYHEYCMSNNLQQMSDKAVKITMSNELGITEQRIYEEGNRNYCWEGIKLKPNERVKEKDVLLKHLNNIERASFKDLKIIINDDKLLSEVLNKLTQQGDIKEMPVGYWRLI